VARIRSRVMVGRDAELRALEATAVRARQGEVALVLVTGEAGIGKSRLVSEFVAGLGDALSVVSHGVAMSTGEIPFGLLADLLKNLLRADPTVLTDDEREALGPLLPGPARGGDRITMLSAALDLLERLSSDRLLVWVVDDLHWADAASRDLLGVALRTGPGHRLLVVATVRTDDPSRSSEEERAVAREVAQLAQLPVAETLPLGPLGLADVRRQLTGMDVSVDAVARFGIEKLSGGIPFVVEELAASGGGARHATHLTVSRTRLAGLPPDARRLVEAAAIGDGHLRLSLLEQVTDLTGTELDQAIKAATTAGVLDEQRSHDELAFRHPLLREAVDESIPPGARRGWHRRWAEVLEANPGVLARSPATIAVAQHWAGSGDTVKSLDAAARAAVAAGELDLHEVEAEMWDRVIQLWDGVARLPGLEQYNEREIRRFRRWAIGHVDHERFLEILDEDLRLAEDPSTRACLELAVTIQHGTALGTSAGGGDLAELEQRARSGPRDLVLAIFLNNLGEAILQEGEPVAARALVEESLSILRERGDTRTAVRVVALLAYLQAAEGTAEAAIAPLKKLLDDRSLNRRPYVRRWLGNALMLLYQLVGDVPAAEAAFEMVASTLDTRLDWPTYEAQLNYIMRTWLDTGRWEHARKVYETLRPNWTGHVVMSDLHAVRLELMSRGQVSDPAFWRHLPDREPDPGGVDPVSAALVAAQVCGAEGDLVRMRELLATVWSQAHPQFSDHAVLGIMWAAVRDFSRAEVDAAVQRPDPADRAAAEAHLATIVDYAGRMHRYGGLGRAWPVELEAQLARFGGDHGRTNLFETAAARWQAIGHVYDAAVCRLRLAEAHAGSGERMLARTHAQTALDTARALGAVPLGLDAGTLLERLGSTQRADGLLTRREREVLTLIAQGHTNEQIAATLYMSPKTASVHVSRIITKLGATNRTQASAIARQTGLVTE
jgi:DNA-binding CsgD family transcriptional regulator